MPTLLYAPEVEVHIQMDDNSIVDISADLVSCDLTLTENQVNTFSFSLNNPRRKYDGLFTPNDRIVVRMKRIRWLQVFSGYLDEVPFFSVYPRAVPMRASDTLKRLKYRPWDAGATPSFQLLHEGDGNSAQELDGGLRKKTTKLLTDVADWPPENIHIGALPPDWFNIVAKIQAKFVDEAAAQQAQISVGGASSIAGGGGGVAAGILHLPGPIPTQTGVLPATSGLVSTFGGPGDPTTANGHMALTGESGYRPGVPGIDPEGHWYCAMRWPYVRYRDGVGKGPIVYTTNASDAAQAIAWWTNRRILVTNPKNGKTVCVRAADWGPGGVSSADRRVLDLAPAAALALGLATDEEVNIRFAADNSTPCGPISYTPTSGPGSAPHGAASADLAGAKQDAAFSPTSTPPGSDHPIALVPVTVPAGAVSFTPVAGVGAANTSAAHQFIAKMWPGLHGIGGYRPGSTVAGTNKRDDHSTGYAVDCMVNGGGAYPDAEQEKLGNSIALWFVQNPKVFGTKYVIWKKRINGVGHETEGWRDYTVADNLKLSPTERITDEHWDHVHISFTGGGDGPDVSALGPSGGGWAGSDASDAFYAKGFGVLGSIDGLAGSTGGSGFLNTFGWKGQQDEFSNQLGGNRALLNDHPVLSSIQDMVQASMRSFMAAPNGDFIAWFPDYFGLYEIAGRLHISDIEMAGDGFTVSWSDDSLITHQFTAGSAIGYNTSGSAGVGGIVDQIAQETTAGIATVEYPEIMEALFNAVPSDPQFKKFFDSKSVLDRFGARPDFQPMGTISGPIPEFWYALYLFQKNWAAQFSSQVNLTFMPEAYPGMLLVLDAYKFQAYIESVTHRFDFSEGGGATTSVRIIAPSRIDGGGLYGLPVGGGHTAVNAGPAAGRPVIPDATPKPAAKPPHGAVLS